MSGTLNSLFSRLAGDEYGLWAVLVELVLIGLWIYLLKTLV